MWHQGRDPPTTGEDKIQAAAREKVAFKVKPPTKSIVQVSENSVDAGGEYEAIAVTYTVQDYVYKGEFDIHWAAIKVDAIWR